MSLQDELRANFNQFNQSWRIEANTTLAALDVKHDTFGESYSRIASIQAWRTSIIESTLDADSAAFFFEAQNDLLVSHCLAHLGSFRQSLKALRSAIENILFTIYYKDHSVELRRWKDGEHKLGFTELIAYVSSHPLMKGISDDSNGVAKIKEEYSTLSKAVHASAKRFRMTNESVENRLWINDVTELSCWATRENAVIKALNLLLLHCFADKLKGAAHPNLRQLIGLVIPKKRHIQIRSDLQINLAFK